MYWWWGCISIAAIFEPVLIPAFIGVMALCFAGLCIEDKIR
jgi:hypothetical protein